MKQNQQEYLVSNEMKQSFVFNWNGLIYNRQSQNKMELIMKRNYEAIEYEHLNVFFHIYMFSLTLFFWEVVFTALSYISATEGQLIGLISGHSLFTLVINNRISFIQCGKSRITALSLNIVSGFCEHFLFLVIDCILLQETAQYYLTENNTNLLLRECMTEYVKVSLSRFLDYITELFKLFCPPIMESVEILKCLILAYLILSHLVHDEYYELITLLPSTLIVISILKFVIVCLVFFLNFENIIDDYLVNSKYTYKLLFYEMFKQFATVAADYGIYLLFHAYALEFDKFKSTSVELFLVMIGSAATKLITLNPRAVLPIEHIKILCLMLISELGLYFVMTYFVGVTTEYEAIQITLMATLNEYIAYFISILEGHILFYERLTTDLVYELVLYYFFWLFSHSRMSVKFFTITEASRLFSYSCICYGRWRRENKKKGDLLISE